MCPGLPAASSILGAGDAMWRDLAFFIIGFLAGLTAAFWVLIYLAR